MRDKETVIKELKAAAKDLSRLADELPDCGGIQAAAVMAANPELVERFKALGREAEALGVTREDLSEA